MDILIDNELVYVYISKQMNKNYYSEFLEQIPCGGKIIKDAFGKPYILSRGEIYFFSISHTCDFTIFVLAKKNIPIGIDFEEKIISDRVFKKISRNNEIDFLYQKNYLWSFKEALGKAIGTGLAVGFDNLNIKSKECNFFDEKRFVVFKHIDFYNVKGTVVLLKKMEN